MAILNYSGDGNDNESQPITMADAMPDRTEPPLPMDYISKGFGEGNLQKRDNDS